MSDLARLGLRIESEEVATADKRLDDFTVAAERAEKASDGLTSGSKRTSSALMEMLATIQRDVASLTELQRAYQGASRATEGLAASSKLAEKAVADVSKATKGANDNIKLYSGRINDMDSHVQLFLAHQKKLAAGAKLQAHEVTNLGRQFADIGVMLGSGQNPFMTLLQQGPQVADVFASAGARGMGFKAVLAEIGAMAAPFVAVLAPIAVVVGGIAGAFAISAQQINKDNKDLIKGLHLTEDQLERVKNKTVTMGDVMKGTWNAAAGALTKAFAPEIKATSKFIGDFYQGSIDWAVRGVKAQVGSWVGGYEAIRATWRMLPAVLGDMTYSTANVVIRGVEASVNAAIDLINGLVERANGISAKLGLPQLGRLDSISLAGIENPYVGAAAKAGEAAGKAFGEGAKRGAGYVDAAMAAIESETLKAYRERVLKEAGKGPKGKKDKDPLEESELYRSVRLFQHASKARGEAMDEEFKRVEKLKEANTRLIEEHERQVELARRAIRDDGYGAAVSAIRGVRDADPNAEMERRKAAYDQIAEFERMGVITHRDAEAAKAAIDRQYAQERLSTASDFFGNLASLMQVKNRELQAIGRAAAIVQATIDGVLAVQKALAAYPPPINFAMAAAVGTVAAVNVAKIAGFKEGGWTGNGGIDEISGVTHGQEFVVKAGPAAANRAMLEAMNAGRPLPAPARPEPLPANSGGRVLRVITEASPYFTTRVEEVADSVARPLAVRARDEGARRGMAGAADQYTRRNVKALR